MASGAHDPFQALMPGSNSLDRARHFRLNSWPSAKLMRPLRLTASARVKLPDVVA